MQNELLTQGLNLLIFGMGIVFVFLTLLVFVTATMSKFVLRYLPEPLKPTEKQPGSAVGAMPNERTMAIIREAIKQHRRS